MSHQRAVTSGRLTLVIALLLAGSAAAGDDPAGEAYRLAWKWRSSKVETAVPPGGVSWSRDTATWTLESGTVRPLESRADGSSPGFVFEGKGRFHFGIPDSFEVEQLRRFTTKPDLKDLDLPFSRLVIYGSSDTRAIVAAPPAGEVLAEDSLVKNRHLEWLRYGGFDVPARAISASLTPGVEFLIVDMDTADFGWMLYQYDGLSCEPIQIIKLQHQNEFPEVWVSIARPADRNGSGRAVFARHDVIAIRHVDIAVDLTNHPGSQLTAYELSLRKPARFRATVTLEPLLDGVRAADLVLDPEAHVTDVTDSSGAPLTFFRDHVGTRFAGVGNEMYNRGLVVVLPKPAEPKQAFSIVVAYDLKIWNFVSGRDWYPGIAEGWGNVHTANLTFSLGKKAEVRAVGRQIREEKTPSGRNVEWSVEKPTKMLGFVFGEGFREERIKLDGVPEVVAFGSSTGLVFGNQVRNVAIDVANSLSFYQRYYGMTLPVDRIWATAIAGYHGQAFEGMLHLSQFTFDSEHPGASELFRAHETAHEFWGYLVGWKSYRDQWLSEAFAEYAAMQFVEASMPNDRYFDEIIEVYNNEQTGSIKTVMSKFSRPFNILMNDWDRKAVGPIAAGWRASTARVPQGYFRQVYNRGALVLHMLRSIVNASARDRDVFREIMQEFLRSYSGKEASTDDFRRVIEAKTQANWQAFFDEWVYSNTVPTFVCRSEVGPPGADGKVPVTLKVETRDVPAGFRTPLPVRIEFGKDRAGTVFVSAAPPETTTVVKLPEKPTKVLFNPRHAILGRVKQ